MAADRRSGWWWKVPAGALALLIVTNLAGFDPIGSLRESLFGIEDRPKAASTTLVSIKEVAELKVATGTFSVPVMFGEDQDGILKKVIPDAFDGNSGVAIYEGSVDAFVDLSSLTEDDIEIDRKNRSIVITVPEPELSDPNVDESRSQVVVQNRGVFTRVGEFFDDKPLSDREKLDDVAVEALVEAADQSNLAETARDNAETFLTDLAKNLGYDTVTVRFEAPPRDS